MNMTARAGAATGGGVGVALSQLIITAFKNNIGDVDPQSEANMMIVLTAFFSYAGSAFMDSDNDGIPNFLDEGDSENPTKKGESV